MSDRDKPKAPRNVRRTPAGGAPSVPPRASAASGNATGGNGTHGAQSPAPPPVSEVAPSRSVRPPASGRSLFARIGAAARLATGVVLVVGASLGAAYGAKVYVTKSNRFAIKTVTVEGANKLAPEAVAALGSVNVGANIFSLDVDAATRGILGDPYVAKATVTRKLPGTVAIAIVEREPRAMALVGEDLFLVTSEGEIFKRVAPGDAVDVVTITGITEEDLSADREGATEKARKALDTADQIEKSGIVKRYSLQEIHVAKDGSLSAVVGKEGIAISLGHPPVRGKIEQAERVLLELGKRKATADVIFVDNEGSPDRVVVRMR